MQSYLRNMYFNYSDIEKRLKEEKMLSHEYKASLDPYSDEEPTTAAVLNDEYITILDDASVRIKASVRAFYSAARARILEGLENLRDSDKKRYSGITAEIVLANPDLVRHLDLSEEEKKLYDKYTKTRKRNPNYPGHMSRKPAGKYLE